jgi:hypothetical protein
MVSLSNRLPASSHHFTATMLGDASAPAPAGHGLASESNQRYATRAHSRAQRQARDSSALCSDTLDDNGTFYRVHRPRVRCSLAITVLAFLTRRAVLFSR